ncbi:MAG: MurT ligase domain-containing protein, partial [Nocardioidaceae bacterium]
PQASPEARLEVAPAATAADVAHLTPCREGTYPVHQAPRLDESAGRGLADLRLTAALVASRLTAAAIRLAHRGGGTSAPGLVADRIDPDLATKLTRVLPDGAVVIAGTNGKTTIARMVADMLESDGRRVVHNRSGSNMMRGIVATLARRATVSGRLDADVAVIEADENALPDVLSKVGPRIVLLNNLFRDQLDRYGEIDHIATRWRAALSELTSETAVIVNGDDPSLVAMTDGLSARRIMVGLDDPKHALESTPLMMDAANCRYCGTDLAYEAIYAGHLGAWRCPGCGRERPELDLVGRDIELHGVESLAMTVDVGGSTTRVAVGVPGLYNAYNLLAAVAVARAAGVGDSAIATALKGFSAAFGRIERVSYRGRDLLLVLAKNPVGFDEVLRLLTHDAGALTVPTMISINDRSADGSDVSWLWDVDFERLASTTTDLYAAGLRAADMANRLKYAGVPLDRIHEVDGERSASLDRFVGELPDAGQGYLLCTYTAMLDLRAALADRGAVRPFWEQ